MSGSMAASRREFPRVGPRIVPCVQGLERDRGWVARSTVMALLSALVAVNGEASETPAPAAHDVSEARRVVAHAMGRAPAQWRDLFDGCSLAGSRVATKPADRAMTWWWVEEGTIVADSTTDPNDDAWRLSAGELSDFVLERDGRTSRDGKGDSGMPFCRRHGGGADWRDGPQVDIHPPARWRAGLIDETREGRAWGSPRRGGVSDARPTMAGGPAPFRYARDPEEWNRMCIAALGGRVLVKLNGVRVRDVNRADGLFDEAHTRCQVGRRGPLALHIHAREALRIEFHCRWIATLDHESR